MATIQHRSSSFFTLLLLFIALFQTLTQNPSPPPPNYIVGFTEYKHAEHHCAYLESSLGSKGWRWIERRNPAAKYPHRLRSGFDRRIGACRRNSETGVGERSQVTSMFGAEDLWVKGYTSAKVKMTIFDTGIRADHPHFRNIKERTNWTNEDTLKEGSVFQRRGGKGDKVANGGKTTSSKDEQSSDLKLVKAADTLQGIQEQMIMLSRDQAIKLPVTFDKGLQYAKSSNKFTDPKSIRRILEYPYFFSKLAKPRQLHNSQWGMMCPAETPEGQACGPVKNLALMVYITVGSAAYPILEFLEEWGTENFEVLV
ncbi:RNA polymerase Rpb2, domain 3 [Sesbania bispinosa]|nr:RNA polymerase Rpb2, domain 3 [Sesbania bispinosa]